MKARLGEKGRRRLRLSAVAIAVLAATAIGGRALLDSSAKATGTSTTVAPHIASKSPSNESGTAGASPSQGASSTGGSSSASLGLATPQGSGATAGTAGGAAAVGGSTGQSLVPGSQQPSTTTSVSPVQPVGPDVVKTATLNMGVSKGAIGPGLTKISAIATSVGGYVDSSSISGGTARSAPLSGKVVIRVPATEFTNVMSALSGIGRLTSEDVSGQDVTGQVAENAATIAVLQQEVNLLQSKLAQATQISTFLQIDAQLTPVQQQLDQLESQQNVLQDSVTLATITANLSAPGAPAAAAPLAKAKPSAARVAWHYATHNTLAVADGIAVAVGWALPLIVLALIVWLVWTRILRRRRPGVTTGVTAA